jgi:PHP family Zn ribbon phosphoesterase
VNLYVAELHVHTVLSPCAEVEMIPPLIVEAAVERGIQILAICDHNASGNIASVQKAAAGKNLTVLPGMELQTKEEVHLVCLFDTLDQIATWQARVDGALPRMRNKPQFFGEQYLVDETGDFVANEERLLAVSANISLEEAVHEVSALGGIAIPAHVDRRTNGLIANLGFIPPNLEVAALEISRHTTPTAARRTFPQLGDHPLVQNGDAHRLTEMLGANEFLMEAPTTAEIGMALKNLQGRSHRILSG